MLLKGFLGLIAVLILLVVGWSFGGLAPGYPYGYDEADYMWAGTRGIRANFLDQNAQSFPSFVRQGIDLMRSPKKRSAASESLRESGDIGIYRHFHGPVYYYWLAMGQSLGWSDPSQYRGSGMAIHLAMTVAAMGLYWWLFPSFPVWGGLLAGLLVGLNRTALFTTRLISQHLIFAFISLLTLGLMGRFLRDFNPRWLYATSAVLALAYATVESAAFLTLGLLASLIPYRKELLARFEGWRGMGKLIGKGAAVWAGTLLVCWPMGVLALNIFKGYMAMGYMALARKTFSPLTFVDMWMGRWAESPWELSTVLVGVPFLWVCRHRLPREASPFLAYAAVFFLLTFKLTIPFTHYHGSFMIACAMSVAVGVACFAREKPYWCGLGLFAGMGLLVGGMALSYHAELTRNRDNRPPLDEILAFFANPARSADGKRWFLPFEYLPTIHFYHPEVHLTAYDVDWSAQRLGDVLRSYPAHAAGLICESKRCEEVRQILGPVEVTNPQRVATRYLKQPLEAIERLTDK